MELWGAFIEYVGENKTFCNEGLLYYGGKTNTKLL